MYHTVAIIGRPNVGKSTFFNRMIGKPRAIVDNVAGVTRDRQYGICEWNGVKFHIIDTGGFVENTTDIFEKEIAKQVRIAVSEAYSIIFMTDAHTGITNLDTAVARLLYKVRKPIYLVVNKADTYEHTLSATEFYTLGFDKIYTIASANGSGTGDLLDTIIKDFPAPNPSIENETTDIPKIAIIGQPNVGKSTFLNALTREERSIVSDIPGTTRDAISIHYKLFQKDFILTDTAGIRKKNKEKEDLEFYSIIRAVKAIDSSDVILLLIDTKEGIKHQDLHLFNLVVRKGKGIVLLVNKWDLADKTTQTTNTMTTLIKEKIAPFTDVPILFISAMNKLRIFKAVETALTIVNNKKIKIETARLNAFLQKTLATHSAPAYRGHLIKIKYATQLNTVIPSFLFFCNFPEGIKEPYKNYLENQLRQTFNFTGIPIRLYFRKK